MHLFAGLRRALNFFSGGILLAHVQHVCNLSRFFLLSKRRAAAAAAAASSPLRPRVQHSSVRQFFQSFFPENSSSALLCSAQLCCVGVPFHFTHQIANRAGTRRARP